MNILLGRECASEFLIFVRKYRKYTIKRWRDAVHSVCFRCDFTIKTVINWVPVQARFKNVSHVEAFLFIYNTFSCWLVL